MPWEIAHRDHPEATGPRYEQLARAAEEISKKPDPARWYARWMTKGDRQDG